MEEAAAVRRTARATVDDIEPVRLRDDLLAFIDDVSLAPGVLTLFTARICSGSTDGLEKRAAGVQLIYNGLRLTRQLAREEPWEGSDRTSADMHILAADVLVARGFYLLSRTEAAATAVDVVRAFGRNQTNRRKLNDSSLDAQLEHDVLELALATGASVASADAETETEADVDMDTDADADADAVDVTPDLRAIANDLAAVCGDTTGFPAPETFLSEAVTTQLTRSVAEASPDS